MKLIYKMLIALNSTILLLVIYLIKEHIALPILFLKCEHISYERNRTCDFMISERKSLSKVFKKRSKVQ